jgi:hypothetical protein
LVASRLAWVSIDFFRTPLAYMSACSSLVVTHLGG